MLDCTSKANDDFIFIDIRMPQLNGFELVKGLRKKDPKVKVCFMTAFESYYNAMKEEYPTLNAKMFHQKTHWNQEFIVGSNKSVKQY